MRVTVWEYNLLQEDHAVVSFAKQKLNCLVKTWAFSRRDTIIQCPIVPFLKVGFFNLDFKSNAGIEPAVLAVLYRWATYWRESNPWPQRPWKNNLSLSFASILKRIAQQHYIAIQKLPTRARVNAALLFPFGNIVKHYVLFCKRSLMYCFR